MKRRARFRVGERVKYDGCICTVESITYSGRLFLKERLLSVDPEHVHPLTPREKGQPRKQGGKRT
jgi:hypothetical protein